MKRMIMGLIVAGAVCAQAAQDNAGKHLFILSGQSNMVKIDPAESFTPVVHDAFGAENVLVIKDASGGKPIRMWYRTPESDQEGKATGELYERLMNKVKPVVENQHVATVTFVWLQGEADANRKHMGGEEYADNLRGLIRQLEKDLGRDDLHVVIGRINDYGIEKPEKCPHWTLVRDAQVEVAESRPRTAWGNSDDLKDVGGWRGKRTKTILQKHQKGRIILGQRFAEQAIELIRRIEDGG